MITGGCTKSRLPAVGKQRVRAGTGRVNAQQFGSAPETSFSIRLRVRIVLHNFEERRLLGRGDSRFGHSVPVRSTDEQSLLRPGQGHIGDPPLLHSLALAEEGAAFAFCIREAVESLVVPELRRQVLSEPRGIGERPAFRGEAAIGHRRDGHVLPLETFGAMDGHKGHRVFT